VSQEDYIYRLIQQRMEQIKQYTLVDTAFLLFRLAFVRAMIEQRERDASIASGDPNTPVSWDGLEAFLGKKLVDRFRKSRP